MEHLQYPIGRFLPEPTYSAAEISQLVNLMQTAPARYSGLTAHLSDTDLAKTYREGSWTIRQLVHHVADIHLLNFLRLKKALTEANYEATLIKMDAWAATPDAAAAPVSGSLIMLDGINQRFVYLLQNLTESQLAITYYHPSRQLYLSIPQAIYMAVWHLEHHLAPIELAVDLTPHTFTFRQVS